MPVMTKKSVCSALLSDAAARLFFCCSNTASSVAPVSMRKVSTCSCPCSEDQRVPFCSAVVLVRELGRAGRRARRSPGPRPAASRPRCLRGFDGGGERRALLRAQHAGVRILVPRLERLHGGDQPLAELAVDRAGEVAGPGEVVLDRDAVGARDRGVGVLQARRLRGRRAGRGIAGGRRRGSVSASPPGRCGLVAVLGGGLRLGRGFCARLRLWRRAWPLRWLWRPAWRPARARRSARMAPAESPCASAADAPRTAAKIAAATRIPNPETQTIAPRGTLAEIAAMRQ